MSVTLKGNQGVFYISVYTVHIKSLHTSGKCGYISVHTLITGVVAVFRYKQSHSKCVVKLF